MNKDGKDEGEEGESSSYKPPVRSEKMNRILIEEAESIKRQL